MLASAISAAFRLDGEAGRAPSKLGTLSDGSSQPLSLAPG
jgi:hypothetical protein